MQTASLPIAQSGLFKALTEIKELFQESSASIPLGNLYPRRKSCLTGEYIPLTKGVFSS